MRCKHAAFLKALAIFLFLAESLSAQQQQLPLPADKCSGLSAEERALVSQLDNQLRRKVIEMGARGNSVVDAPTATYRTRELLQMDEGGRVRVEVCVEQINARSESMLAAAGMIISYRSVDFHRYDGWLPLNAVTDVAMLPFVSFVRAVERPLAQLTSAGDTFHRADLARFIWGANGAGRRVGIIATGISHRAAAQSAGELPSVQVIRNRVAGDEGTAMLEIVHDLAPGASLSFADATSESDMAASIDLLWQAGCQIICDDLVWPHEPAFEQGIIAQRVNGVSAGGGIYVAAAGNFRDRHYIGDYVNAGSNWNRFELSGGYSSYVRIRVEPGNDFQVWLQWNDKYGKSGNDYDLYLYDSQFTEVDRSTWLQDGNDDPFEIVSGTNTTSTTATYYVAILNYNGTAGARKLQLWTDASLESAARKSVSSSFGHANAIGCISVGAIDASSAQRASSAEGPALLYSFDSNGNPISSIQLVKPDISALDGVETYVGQQGYFLNPFNGTSAAAPHIAGLAAIVWSNDIQLSSTQVISALYNGAVGLPLSTSERNCQYGTGRADAYNSLNAVDPANPVPVLTGIAPQNQVVGGSGFTLSVSGSGFVANSIVKWDDSARSTSYLSNGMLTAQIAAADIASSGSKSVTVYTPAPGGGTTTPQTFSINNPLPVLNGLSPSNISAGGGSFTLTVSGSGFVPTSKVRWDSSERPTTYFGASELRAAIPATDIASAGSKNITVHTPSPGGGTSTPKTFTVNNPLPIITAVSPTSVSAGGGSFTLNVSGSGFVPTSKVRWEGSDRVTTFDSPNELRAAIRADDIASAGTKSVTVNSPAPGGGTTVNTRTVSVTNPFPALTSIDPPNKTSGEATFTLTVKGTNFVQASRVRWGGNDRTTTYVSATRLTATIPASDIASAGTKPVTVYTPTPGGGTSTSQTFTINNPLPVVTTITPTGAIAGGGPVALTVEGSGFVSTSKVRWGGSDKTTTYQSPTRLTASIPAADIATAGTIAIAVRTPEPGGGTSSGRDFVVTSANLLPSLTSVSPSTVTAGGAPFQLTVSGASFMPISTVRWNGSDRTTTYVNPMSA